MHRKNSLFYRTAAGTKTGDIYMTLIQTCQRNGIDPWDYLTELQLNHEAVKREPERWLPWNYKLTLALKGAVPPNPPPETTPKNPSIQIGQLRDPIRAFVESTGCLGKDTIPG